MKFYLVHKNAIIEPLTMCIYSEERQKEIYSRCLEIKDNHIVISLKPRRNILINLSDEKLQEIKRVFVEEINFKKWERDFLNCNEIDKYKFLISKHNFVETYRHDGFIIGLNIFELSNDDLMYMKLMGWL